MSSKIHQTIRYVRASDGVQIAWAESGTGAPLVKAATWLTHLEYDLESPVWHHWTSFLSNHFRYIRYDERGCGMTEWNVGDMSMDRKVEDLKTVIDAAGITEPVTLLGMSHGAAVCIAFAVRYPQLVARMIFYGGFARGALKRNNPDAVRTFEAIISLSSQWGSDNPAFRQVFTSRFIPGGTDEQLRWFNELCLKTTSPELAGELLRTRGLTDVSSLLSKVRVPTLVIHARQDGVCPVSEGRLIATEIAGAHFVELESRNHVLLEHEPAWTRFQEEVLGFAGVPKHGGAADAFNELSPRERETLSLLAEGLSNSEIAERLGISEKTVRNHLSHLFDKLGVWSRAQAIVFARDRGFRG